MLAKFAGNKSQEHLNPLERLQQHTEEGLVSYDPLADPDIMGAFTIGGVRDGPGRGGGRPRALVVCRSVFWVGRNLPGENFADDFLVQ